ARSMTPAMSQPVRLPGGLLASPLTSPRLSEIALTATSASLGSGWRSGASVSLTPGSAEQVRRASTARPYNSHCAHLLAPPGPGRAGDGARIDGDGPARPPRLGCPWLRRAAP